MEVERLGFKDKLSTARMNLEVFACTGIILLVSVLYYFIGFNNYTSVSSLDYMHRVIYIYLLSISTSILWDVLFNIYRLFGKKRISFKEYIFKVFSSFSFVSGGIIALLLPVGTKLYLVPLATFVAIIICKNVFGGYGKNLLNPAILGVLAVTIFFKPSYYLGEITQELTSEVTFRTTPLFQTLEFPNSYASINNDFRINLWDIFNGFYVGEIGTTQSFVLIIILVYLIGRKIIDYRLSLTYIFSYFIMSFLLFSLSKLDISMVLYNSFTYFIVGPALFIGVFVVSDPVTAPLTGLEKVKYALSIAATTFLALSYTNNLAFMFICVLLFNIVNAIYKRVYKSKKYVISDRLSLVVLILIALTIPVVRLYNQNMLFFQ